MLKFSAILLVALFVNCIFAKFQFAALDHCTPYQAKNINPYSDFTPTTTIAGVTTLNFYVLTTGRYPHIQLNAEPNPTSDYYEFFITNGRCNLNRYRKGDWYITLGHATRKDLLRQLEPLQVRLETKLQPDGKRVFEIFVHDELTPFLTGVDSLPPVQPLYQAYGTFQHSAKFYYNCKPIPAPVCTALENQISRQLTLIASLESDVARFLKIISDAYTQSRQKIISNQ